LRFPLRAPFGSSTFKFGTLDVLEHIRKVVREFDTPSWVRSVPNNFGAASAGTLKADQWRTMATIYLPVALVSLWGRGMDHPSPEIKTTLQKALDHTMVLVFAILLACKRTTTLQHATLYRNYLATWVGNLKKVHPNAKHNVNGHMAFHIYDFLLLFGPVHSWWCFAFERLIGQLQRLPSNHKLGMSKFCFIVLCLTYNCQVN
jgi:hypothetical protein